MCGTCECVWWAEAHAAKGCCVLFVILPPTLTKRSVAACGETELTSSVFQMDSVSEDKLSEFAASARPLVMGSLFMGATAFGALFGGHVEHPTHVGDHLCSTPETLENANKQKLVRAHPSLRFGCLNGYRTWTGLCWCASPRFIPTDIQREPHHKRDTAPTQQAGRELQENTKYSGNATTKVGPVRAEWVQQRLTISAPTPKVTVLL